MSLYKRGGTWWYKFKFEGVLIRESTGLTNIEAAREAEGERHNDLRKSRRGIHDRPTVPMFSPAAEAYMKAGRRRWAPKTAIIEATNLGHLQPVFGKRLLTDITADDVGCYWDDRRQEGKEGTAEKTISLELGTLRGILLHHDLDEVWCGIRKKVKLKKARNVGRAITLVEQDALLRECRASRSRSLHVAVVVALETCLRCSEIQLLKWRQIDLAQRTVKVEASKTEAGEGRVVPLSRSAHETLRVWASEFPARKPNHFVFPSEKYGQGGCVYDTDVTKPTSWKEAWEHAQRRAGVSCRFHDLRHTGCTRLLDAGVSHPVVAEIMGWSASTAIRMIKEVYGHINLATRARAIEQRDDFMEAQNPTPLAGGTEVGTNGEPGKPTIQ